MPEERRPIRKRKERLILTRKKGRSYQEATETEAEMIKEAQDEFGRKWRAGLKSKRRERYTEVKDSHIEITDFTERDKELIKACFLAMGSVQKRYNTCGKDDCPCRKDRSKRHGPYYYLSMPLPKEMVDAGLPRMRHFYITAQEAAKYGKRIEMFNRLQDEIWDELWDEFVGSELAIFD